MNDIANLKIGKAAELAGVNKETIRYYERRRLIPEPERMDTGCTRGDIRIKYDLLKELRNLGLLFLKLKRC